MSRGMFASVTPGKVVAFGKQFLALSRLMRASDEQQQQYPGARV
jgi:hypothetical protein